MGSSGSATTTGRYWSLNLRRLEKTLQRADQVEERQPWVEHERDRLLLLGCHPLPSGVGW